MQVKIFKKFAFLLKNLYSQFSPYDLFIAMHAAHLHDYIELANIELELSVGVFDWEKRLKQKLKLDIFLFQDHRLLADNIENTVDYGALYKELCAVLSTRHFELIETIADFVAVWLLTNYNIIGADVKIKKFHAVQDTAYVAARALRFKSDSEA